MLAQGGDGLVGVDVSSSHCNCSVALCEGSASSFAKGPVSFLRKCAVVTKWSSWLLNFALDLCGAADAEMMKQGKFLLHQYCMVLQGQLGVPLGSRCIEGPLFGVL